MSKRFVTLALLSVVLVHEVLEASKWAPSLAARKVYLDVRPSPLSQLALHFRLPAKCTHLSGHSSGMLPDWPGLFIAAPILPDSRVAKWLPIRAQQATSEHLVTLASTGGHCAH